MKNIRTSPEARTLLLENKRRGLVTIRFYLIFSGLSVIIILLISTARLRINPLSELDLSAKSQGFSPAKAGEIPKLEIQNFKLIQTAGEKKQWELLAASALEYDEGVEIQIKDTTIKFFKNNKVVLTLNAQEGTVDLKTKDINIFGAVNAVSSEGLELKTDSLRWLASDEKLVTDDHIILRRAGMKIEGKGLEADASLGKLQVKKEARVEVPRKKERQ